MSRTLEGVRRQSRTASTVADDRGPVHIQATDPCFGERREKSTAAALIATKRGEYHRVGVSAGAGARCGVNGVLDAERENRVGADLDEGLIAVVQQTTNDRFQLDRLAHVAKPVLAVECFGIDGAPVTVE